MDGVFVVVGVLGAQKNMRKSCRLNLTTQKSIRQYLRKNQTEAEDKLWSGLRNKQLGVKFARQDGIEHFVADFCCRKLKLIIEIDGDIHENKMVAENDFERTKRLKDLGYKILRFTNDQILNSMEEVINQIKKSL